MTDTPEQFGYDDKDVYHSSPVQVTGYDEQNAAKSNVDKMPENVEDIIQPGGRVAYG